MPIGSRIQETCGLEKQAWLLLLPEANLTWLYSRLPQFHQGRLVQRE